MTQYRAVVGLDYPPNKRAEAGDVVTDLPGDSIKWLLEQGLIESTDGKKTTKVEEVVTPVVEEVKEETKTETSEEVEGDE